MSATIRHSALPKLAQCPCYESNPVAGPAAERGTRMDGVFRALLQGKPVTAELTTEELEAVMWAVDTARDIADGADIEADEANLKVTTPGMDHEGTEDARCASEGLSFDLKTGQIRGYAEQAAAYCLGNMEAHFVKNWTCVLLFCDQREFVRHEFTEEEAKQVVNEVLAAVKDPNAQPQACQYCSWCRKADTCVARTVPATDTLAVVEGVKSLQALRQEIAADPQRLGKFLAAAAVFEEELWKPLKDAAKVSLDHGDEVPGWKLVRQSGSEYFDRLAIISAAVAGKSGLDDLVEALGGKMSGKKFREWAGKLGVPVREEQAQRGAEILKLTQSKRRAA